MPIVAGLGASTLLGVTDSVMLAPLGPLPLAAVGITSAVAIILFAAIYGVLSAMAVRVGAAHGAGQGREIPALLRNGLVLGAIVGALGVVAMLAAWPLLPVLGQPPEVLAIMFPYWVSIAVLMLPFSMLMVFKATFEAVDRPWVDRLCLLGGRGQHPAELRADLGARAPAHAGANGVGHRLTGG